MTEMTFEPFGPSDLAAWLVRARAEYIDERIAAGDTPAEAKANAMLLIEQLAQSNGVTSIGLNVFALNALARGLYTSLGYSETSVQMRKVVRPPSRD